jgi:hypothetical protein
MDIIFYSRVLGTTERRSVEGYLAWKWGIKSSLPATHPFYSLPAFSRVFGPLDIPGCALWLDGADSTSMTTSSGNLLTWNDKSGNGYVMTNNTGTTIVASSSLNSLNTVYTPSGTNTKITSFTGRTKCTMFIVGKAAISRYLLALNGGFLYTANDSLLYFYPPTGNYLDLIDSVGLATPVVSNNTWFILCIGYDNATNNTANPYTINGTNRSTVIRPGGTSGILSDQYITSPLYINSANGTNSYDSVYTAEIIYYNNTLTTTQRQQVEGYLAAKWGLLNTLPGKTLSPLNIPGCALWLDGADSGSMTFSGATSNITQWRDKSGLGNHASPRNGSPVFTSNSINGVASIYLSNAPSFTGSISITGTTYTAFAVAVTPSIPNTLGHDQRLLSFAVNSTGADYNLTTSSIGFFNWVQPSDGAGTKIITYRNNTTIGSNVISANVPFMGSALYNGANGYLWSNGTAATTTGAASSGNFAITIYGVGDHASNSPGEYWNGYIGEIIVFSNALTDSQRQQIEGYLASKWGVTYTYPTLHPFKSIPPSTSQPPQFQEVTPGNWTRDWQPYLSNLTRANNSANSTVIPTVAYGTGGASLSPALSTQYYLGGVLAPNGTIYGIPNASSNILMINTATNGVSYGTGGPSLSPALSTQYYRGGVLAPNGNIYCSPTLSSNILIINTSDNSVSYGTGGPSLSPALSTQVYRGGVLAPNGNIYGMPNLSSNILIINTNTNGVSYGTGGPSLSPALSTQYYTGGVLAPNGNIYGMPNGSSNILIINTNTNGVSYGTGGPSLSPALSTQYYSGAILAPNGTIYGMPNGASNILIINTSTNSVSYGTGGPSLSPALSTQYYVGGVLAPNGNIYCIPYLSSNILIINTTTNGVSYGTNSLSPALSTQGYFGGVLAPNGTIYGIPYLSSNILRISNTYTETPSSNYCLSAWTNKL